MDKRTLKRLETIAKRELQMETLEERRMDSLDFHEVGVWGVKRALQAAYELGRQAGMKKGKS